MKKLILLFTISILFLSCTGQSKPADDYSNKNRTDDITVVAKESTFSDNYNTLFIAQNEHNEMVRIYSNQPSEHDKYLLVDDKNFMVVVKYQNDKLIKSDTVFSNEFAYAEIDSSTIQQTKINGKEYVFLAIYETFKGQAVIEKTIYFFSINLSDLTYTNLAYTGKPSLLCDECIDGSFTDVDLRDKSQLKKALYEYALQNKWVYKGTEEEQNIAYYKNYEKKWNADNDADNALANGHNQVPEKINSTYYKEDLFAFTGDYDEDRTIENERYKIVSYFRNNIIGYDKKRKTYFPIFIESCVTGCDKSIRFISENKVEITYNEGETETYQVNLNKIKFAE